MLQNKIQNMNCQVSKSTSEASNVLTFFENLFSAKYYGRWYPMDTIQ